jgi:hypothetical protein
LGFAGRGNVFTNKHQNSGAHGSEQVNIIGEMAGAVLPVTKKMKRPLPI